MERNDLKLLLVLLLQHLAWALRQFVQLVELGIRLSRHYADIIARSLLVLKLTAWADRLAKRPWFRQGRNALYHGAALIVGSTFEDERVAFTARKLVKNDAYRDRLLVPEIEDLVALCDALRLTLPQRKAYFQSFLHVDFMRRSSVSRAELLRYCSLRSTPLTSFLLPNAQEATHRESARSRWDIIQLMAACFSVCTADIVELVQLAVAEAIQPQETEVVDSEHDGSIQEEAQKEETSEQKLHVEEVDANEKDREKHSSICQQISHCLAFFIGVPDAVESNLQALLLELYDEKQQRGDAATPRSSFQEIHGVATIFDVVRLFPGKARAKLVVLHDCVDHRLTSWSAVLVFPCIWTQRVLQTRILGVKTWRCLQQRRTQLQPHLPAGGFLLSVADIVAASQVQLQQKLDRGDQILTPTSDQEVHGAPSTALLNGGSSRSDGSVSSKTSTPRKVAPCIGSELAKSDAETSSCTVAEPSDLRLTFDQCSTSEEAWQVSANHALASVYIQCILEDSPTTTEDLQEEFERTTKQLFARELSSEQLERIRQRLVKLYGYRFAHTLLAKSSVRELNHASKTPLDERRAKQRYAKAWRGSGLVEDKPIYWKEFEDPVAKRAFYYNVRTGESRWEKPANFVGKKKVRRRRKARSTKDQLQPEPPVS